MIREAKCCCGACSISVDGEPVLNGVCHCDNCRRRTGSAFGWSAYFLNSQVRGIGGDLRIYAILPEVSENPSRRWFCAGCGTTLYWRTESFADRVGVAGGCFTASPLEAPALSQWDPRRCPWLDLNGDWIRY